MRSMELGRRILDVRMDLYGEDGGPRLAEAIGVPARTLANYEAGVAISGMVLLKFIEVTGTCPRWLLTGDLPRYTGPGRDRWLRRECLSR